MGELLRVRVLLSCSGHSNIWGLVVTKFLQGCRLNGCRKLEGPVQPNE